MSRDSRMPRAPARSRTEGGYSLMEILIGLAIIALLIGVAGPRIYDLFGRAQGKVAEIQIGNLQGALDQFRLDMRRYPTTEEGLNALLERPARDAERWSGPYLNKTSGITDPWDRPYVYRAAGASDYELGSYGADGAPGGDGEDKDILAE